MNLKASPHEIPGLWGNRRALRALCIIRLDGLFWFTWLA